MFKTLLKMLKTRHFSDSQAYRVLVLSETFKSKGQFVPDLVRNYLVVRILHNVPDFGRLGAQVHLLQILAFKNNLAGPFAVRHQNAF